ncbi:hypothetical protein B4102_1680 [Heyndrickxia sporothermodurans]|uniref:Uncharacterized protein n=1 Tax=Heyndrickxia sporothermodurans TaxID=46224 RepID=A0A150LF44_9BACI|nr:hypothetical protein B4102_1680 [Heyndrickxia sporothermodurans]
MLSVTDISQKYPTYFYEKVMLFHISKEKWRTDFLFSINQKLLLFFL